jgi:hypothetical protein
VSLAELKVVVRRVPAPPCSGCDARERCAKERLSCLDFARYVNLQSWRGRSDRNPSRARYVSMFNTDEE